MGGAGIVGKLNVGSLYCPQITTNGKITTISVVPASFADLAAVRTWLAAQFT